MGGMERRICAIEGCETLSRNKGIYKGKTRWGRLCVRHHKKVDFKPYFYYRKEIPNTKCSYCGWDKAPCDRHRIVPELGYIESNVVILCPNCHRLVGMKLLSL